MKALKLALFSCAIIFAIACSAQPKPDGAIPAAQPAGAASAVPLGSYQCWANGSARMLLNFTVTSAGHYHAADGTDGTFTYNPSTTAIVFTGYEGKVMPPGFTSIYHVPQGRPTVSFRGTGGAEVSFCQLKM